MKKTKVLIIVLLGFLWLLFVNWIGSLIDCRILTSQHYNEFKGAYQQTTHKGDEYFKVLSYRPYRSEIAQVYYVAEDNSSAHVITFLYNIEKKKWDKVSSACIWSKKDNISGVIWPYWWHFIYGGF